jgi:hypothetical protein
MEEFYLSGNARSVQDVVIRQALIADTDIQVDENEVLFELLLDRVMYTRLAYTGTPLEHAVHQKWDADR